MEEHPQNGSTGDLARTMKRAEKRTSSIGNGALAFIRARSSVRKNSKKHCNRCKGADSTTATNSMDSAEGGGIGKWLREHLRGGGKGVQIMASSASTSKTNGQLVDEIATLKWFDSSVYASQNFYCSLPREEGRGARGDRPRSKSARSREKTAHSAEIASLRRNETTYSSATKMRSRRRHSLNESHEYERQRRRRKTVQRAAKDTFASALEMAQPTSVRSASGIGWTMSEDEEVDDPFFPRIFKASFDYAEEEEEEEEEEEVEEEEAEEEGEEGERQLRGDLKEGPKGKDLGDAAFGDSYSAEEGEEGGGGGGGSSFYDEERETEEVVEEKEASRVTRPSADVRSVEKLEEEVGKAAEPDHALIEIPAEVLASRDTMIDMLKRLLVELSSLHRKNKHLEAAVAKHMKKAQRKMTLTESAKTADEMEELYRRAIANYKLQVDEIAAQESQLLLEMENYKERLQKMRSEDEVIFRNFLQREKEMAVGLVYSKTGGKIQEKTMDVLANRQMARRRVLARDRYNYILLRRRFEDVDAQLRSLEVLGDGMTTMDYEALRMANVTHVDKLDERNRELEKLRNRIAELANGMTHLKEKEVCVTEDMGYEREKLLRIREETTETRAHLNVLHILLRDLRHEYVEKKEKAGMLVAQGVLREMDKASKLLYSLKVDMEEVKKDLQAYLSPASKLARRTSER